MTLNIPALARLGATARLQEIDTERREIFRHFPDLKEQPSPVSHADARFGAALLAPPLTNARLKKVARAVVAREARAVLVHTASAQAGRVASKRPWTPARRKEVSTRMRKYWARRRAEKAAKAH